MDKQKGAVSGPEVFERLVLKYEKLLFNIAYRVMGNYEDASDMTQEALIKVYKNLNRLDSEEGFKPWASTIVTNTCIDELRRRRLKTVSLETAEGSLPVAADIETPEESLIADESNRELQTAINKLTDEHKAVIVLRDIQGFSYQEVSDITGATLGTVKSRVARARESLRSMLLDCGRKEQKQKKKTKELNHTESVLDFDKAIAEGRELNDI